MDIPTFASGMIQILQVPCSIAGCVKRRMWFPKLDGLRCGDDGALVLKMCWTLVCMKTGMILQIQSSCKLNPKYWNKTAYKKWLPRLLFCWLFIPWIQRELDSWLVRYNNDKKQADKNKILPQGAPNDIYDSPKKYGVLDFKVRTCLCLQITLDLLSQQIEVYPDAIEDVRQLYAPPDHKVFVLVPMDFATMINKVYVHMENPVIAVDTVWDVYLALHDTLIASINDIPAEVHIGWRYAMEQSATQDAEDVEAFQSKVDKLWPLHGGYEVQDEDGYFYLGGVNGSEGPQEGEWWMKLLLLMVTNQNSWCLQISATLNMKSFWIQRCR